MPFRNSFFRPHRNHNPHLQYICSPAFGVCSSQLRGWCRSVLRPLLRTPTICTNLVCQVPRCWQWGCGAAPGETRTGLSHARHSQFQLPPADSLETLSLCQEGQNAAWQLREKWKKKSGKISPADTKVRAERRAGDAPAQISPQPVMQTTVKQAVPLHSMEVHGGTEINLQPMEDLTLEQLDAQRRLCPCVPMGSPCWSSWQDLQTHGKRSPCWSRFAGRTCDPTRSHGGIAHEELQPW